MYLRFSAKISQLFQLIILAKCVVCILELNWDQRFWAKETKLNICHHILTYVVHTTAKQVISRHGKNENAYEMSKNEKCTCKSTVFHCKLCKWVTSSLWLLELPLIKVPQNHLNSWLHICPVSCHQELCSKGSGPLKCTPATDLYFSRTSRICSPLRPENLEISE